ncbi:sensor histidine kinase [Novipirellula aureliae]|uniref:sensor histidine kinase n=1 Tax=Novipirellula aureliae TaxID=2527966 RepID=UPI0018CD70C4|nr:HAMP domain-containing sensor histidine kinase [Novipirellula aureliae]
MAAKLILLFLGGLLLIVGLFAYLTIQQDRRLALAEHERYAADIAATLRPSLHDASQSGNPNDLQQMMIQSTARVRHTRIRLVEIDGNGQMDQSSYRQPSVPRSMIVTTSEVTTIRMPNPSGDNMLYTYVPLDPSDANVGKKESLEIAAPDTQESERIRRSMYSSILALLGVASLAGGVVWIGGVAMVGRPLSRLVAKVDRAGQGDFGDPIEVKSKDELGGLAIAVNRMCEQLESQRTRIATEMESRLETVEQLRHSDRLSSVGRLAAGIAHEIGTPLNVIGGRAELIGSGQLSEQAIAESAKAIQSETKRITKTIRELLDFARQSVPNRKIQSIVDLAKQTVDLARPLAAKERIELSLHSPQQELTVEIDESQIQQVVMNLIVNAIHSIKDNPAANEGAIDVYVGNAPSSGKIPECRTIAVSDNGIGMNEETKTHIFEPFFTTKEQGRGTGLGLSISHGIVKEHGGWIDVESTPNRGSRFTVYLPVGNEVS